MYELEDLDIYADTQIDICAPIDEKKKDVIKNLLEKFKVEVDYTEEDEDGFFIIGKVPLEVKCDYCHEEGVELTSDGSFSGVREKSVDIININDYKAEFLGAEEIKNEIKSLGIPENDIYVKRFYDIDQSELEGYIREEEPDYW